MWGRSSPMPRRCRHRLCPDWLTRIIINICRNWRENVDKNEFLFDSYPFEAIYVDGLTFYLNCSQIEWLYFYHLRGAQYIYLSISKPLKCQVVPNFQYFFRLFLLLGVLKIRKPPVGKTETQQAHFGLRQIFVTVPDKGTQNKWKLLKNSHSNSYVVGRDSWNYPRKMLACFIISNLDSDGVKMMLKFKSFWPLTWLVPWINPPTNLKFRQRGA